MTGVPLPQHIGRYRVVGLAGKGGFATVYEGFDDRLDDRVAIKVLAEKWADEPEIRRRFRNEAVLMRRLGTGSSAPHLVEVFDIDETDSGQLFFVMGWADRGTLAQRAHNKAWPLSDVKRVVDSLAASLGQLHAGGILHRDIKPSNLLIRSNGSPEQTDVLLGEGERLVLADLGLAKDTVDDTSVLSMAGGTPRFMAPERHVSDAVIDHRVDIYAATRVVEDLTKGRRGTGPVPPAVQAALHEGLATNPDDRPDSMEEWAALFNEVLSVDDPTLLSPTVPPSGPSVQADPVIAAIVTDPLAGRAQTPPPPSVTPTPTPQSITPPPPAVVPAASPPPPVLATASPTAPTLATQQYANSAPPNFAGQVSDPSVRAARKSRLPLLVLALLAVVAAVAAAFVFLRSDSGAIVGPAEIQSGESARYSVADAEGSVIWIDPAGQEIPAQSLEVTGRLPGQLTISATTVDGGRVTRDVTVITSPLGPKIDGPTTVQIGETATWTAEVPSGQEFFWIHPTDGQIRASQLTITAQEDDFKIGLVATDSSGKQRGDQIAVVTE